jgi:thioredoxin 1
MMDEIEKIKEEKMKEMKNRQSGPVKLDDAGFDGLVGSNPVVMVDCYADWCGPCKMMEPTIEALAREYAGKVVVAKLNVDENRENPSKFGIMSIPTLLFFKGGKKVDSIVGAVPADVIKEKLNKLLEN